MRTHRLILLLLAALACPALYAQPQRQPGLFEGPKKNKNEDENVRTVQGTVRDEAEQVVEGAVVYLKDTKSLRVRSFITRDDGGYRFTGLSTNVDYELRADFKASASPTKTLSVFDSRKQAVIHLKLEPKKRAEGNP